MTVDGKQLTEVEQDRGSIQRRSESVNRILESFPFTVHCPPSTERSLP